MPVRVVLTHAGGRPVDPGRLDQQRVYVGALRIYLAQVEGLRRASRRATLRPVDRSVGPPLVPDLFDVELIAYGEQGMMLKGIEEDNGLRTYQGWWIRW
ncbi:MAG: hypothetical protein ABSF50_01460 [Burkholderiaceae bacterium]|jgi:hypothetical protein